jgi:hypothetical protein
VIHRVIEAAGDRETMKNPKSENRKPNLAERGPNLRVARVFNLLYRRISSCRPALALRSRILNAADCPIESDQIGSNGSHALQVKNLRYGPADAGRYAFGLTSTI